MSRSDRRKSVARVQRTLAMDMLESRTLLNGTPVTHQAALAARALQIHAERVSVHTIHEEKLEAQQAKVAIQQATAKELETIAYEKAEVARILGNTLIKLTPKAGT